MMLLLAIIAGLVAQRYKEIIGLDSRHGPSTPMKVLLALVPTLALFYVFAIGGYAFQKKRMMMGWYVVLLVTLVSLVAWTVVTMNNIMRPPTLPYKVGLGVVGAMAGASSVVEFTLNNRHYSPSPADT